MSIAIGQIFANRYRIDDELGQGGFGSVYRAFDPNMQRPVALKVLDPLHARSADYRTRFEREAQVAAQLKSHPHIVQVFDRGEADGTLYLVMELVEHGTLDRRLARYRQTNTPLPINFAVTLLRQAAEGLDHAHAAQVIHRDIKPANLLLQYSRSVGGTTSCTLKIADFGIARLMQSGAPQTIVGVFLGTRDYAPPEQLQGGHVDGRSDVYALAVTGYELLTGERPFGPANDTGAAIGQRQANRILAIRAHRGDVPVQLETLLLRALDPDPARRPDAAELALALRAMQPGTVPPPSLTQLTQQAAGSGQTVARLVGAGGTLPPTQGQTASIAARPRVQVTHKDGSKQRYELTSAGLTVGRDAGHGIAIADDAISRNHLRLEWDGAQVWVTDLGSSNGSTLGGQPLGAHMRTPWPWNNAVRIGGVWLQLIAPAPAAAAATGNGTTRQHNAHATTQRWTQRMSQVHAQGGALAIDLAPGDEQLTLMPGQPAQITVLLANLGPQVDHVTLTIGGVPQGWVAGMPGQPVALNAGIDNEATLPLTIAVPRVAASRAGDYDVTITASSAANPREQATVKARWTVQPFAEGELKLAPRRSRGRSHGEHTLTVRNAGNAPVSYTLSAEDDELALDYRFSRKQCRVEPGGSCDAKLTLEAKRRDLSIEQTHDFTVTAQPDEGGAAITARGEFVQEARPVQTPAPAPPPTPAPAPTTVYRERRQSGGFGCLLQLVALVLVGIAAIGIAAHYDPRFWRGATASWPFIREIENGLRINTAPTWLGIPAQTLDYDEELSLDLNPFVDDKEQGNDTPFKYRVMSSAPPGLDVSISHNRLVIEAQDFTGMTRVELEVEDHRGLTARTDFELTAKEPQITVTNQLMLPVRLSVDGRPYGELGADETTTIEIPPFPVRVNYEVLPETVSGRTRGQSWSAHWSEVVPGDELTIDAQTTDLKYFYLVLSNETNAECRVVVNEKLQSEVDQGLTVTAQERDVGLGYYPFYTNSNVVLHCDDGYYYYWGIFEDRDIPLEYGDPASGLIHLTHD